MELELSGVALLLLSIRKWNFGLQAFNNQSREILLDIIEEKFIIYFGTSYQDTLYDLMSLLNYCLKDESDKEIDKEKEEIMNSTQEKFEGYLEERRLKIYKAIKRKK